MKFWICGAVLALCCGVFSGCASKNLPGYLQGKEHIVAMSATSGGQLRMSGEIYDYVFDANLSAVRAKVASLASLNKDAIRRNVSMLTIDRYNEGSDAAYIQHEIELVKYDLPLSVQAKLMDDPQQLEPAYSSTFRYSYLIEGKYFKRLKDHDELRRSHCLSVPIEYPARIAVDSGIKSERDAKMDTDIQGLIVMPLMMPVLLLGSILGG